MYFDKMKFTSKNIMQVQSGHSLLELIFKILKLASMLNLQMSGSIKLVLRNSPDFHSSNSMDKNKISDNTDNQTTNKNGGHRNN
jgi:hypothetical protein